MKKELVLRSLLFVSLVYIIIPGIFWMSEKYFTAKFEFSFFYFMIFSLMMVGMLAAFNRKEILKFKWKVTWWETLLFLSLSLSFYFTYFVIKYAVLIERPALDIALAYLFYFLGFMSVAVAIFGLRFFNEFKKSILSCIIMVYIFFMGTVAILWNFGNVFARATARIVYFLLSRVIETNLIVDFEPELAVGSYSVIIGFPCSGVESIAMFLGVALLALAYDWKKINWKRGIWLFSLGLVGVFFLNVLRVSTLMLVGNKNQELANNLFHNNLGWIFFVVYAMLILIFIYPRILNK